MKAIWFNSYSRLDVIANQTGVLFLGHPVDNRKIGKKAESRGLSLCIPVSYCGEN